MASFNTKFKEGQFMLSFFIFFINSSRSQVLVCHLFNVSDEAYDVDEEDGDDDNNNEVVDVGVICGWWFMISSFKLFKIFLLCIIVKFKKLNEIVVWFLEIFKLVYMLICGNEETLFIFPRFWYVNVFKCHC